MAKPCLHSGIGARLAGIAAITATVVLGLSFVLTAEHAEAQKKTEKKADVPTSTPKSAWVKLCEKGPVNMKDKEGKELKKELNICETMAERIDANSGMVIISTGLRVLKIDSEEKHRFMMTLPHGVLLPVGAAVTFVPKDLWPKIEKNEKLEKDDEPKLKQAKLPYAFCSAVGCHIDVEFKDEVLKTLKTSAGFIVATAHANGMGVTFKVPLAGFNEALAGPAMDTKKFAEARLELMKEIKARREEMVAEFKKKQEELNKMQPNVAAPDAKKSPATPKK